MKSKLFFPVMMVFFAAAFFTMEGKQDHTIRAVESSLNYQPGEPDLKIIEEDEMTIPSLNKLY